MPHTLLDLSDLARDLDLTVEQTRQLIEQNGCLPVAGEEGRWRYDRQTLVGLRHEANCQRVAQVWCSERDQHS